MALAVIQDIPQRVFVQARDRDEFSRQRDRATDEFCLPNELVEFVPVIPMDGRTTKDDLLRARDRAVIDAADLLIPVSIRKAGGMTALLVQSSKQILRSFEIEYANRQSTLAYTVATDSLNPALRTIGGQYLTHWTRGTNTAWPEERLIDFYRDVTESNKWPRGAFDTLRRIMRMKRIIASGRHMPGAEKTVAFSALSTLDVIPLMRWRARYSQMAFEPYGIGIEKEYALRCGVAPVEYGKDAQHDDCGEVPVWRRQSVGQITDWRTEEEYRHPGDFPLHEIPADNLIFFCHYHDQAITLEREFGIRAVAFIA